MALCPRCRIPLRTHTITTDVERWEVEVDVCSTSCGGIWLQAHDFEADSRANLLMDLELVALNQPKRQLNARAQEGSATCPDCKIPMTRYNWNNQGLFIDNCKRCKGRWFDGGEIRGIYEILKRR
ncbi:MAG: zf-TFIIB domain-containing protein [Candidatus Sericytochromatia bacterium]|nr:zf-TFIIB domain-containing protein [Candidatus Sericytochromatia bacterium]